MLSPKNQSILVTGVFDVLHAEHINFLQKAKALGGRLAVGIECDERVKRIKGKTRPVNSQEVRKANLEKLEIADEIFILPSQFDTPDDRRKLLQQIQPSVLAVSSHTPHLAQKIRLMSEIGGRVEVVLECNPAVSSSKIIESTQDTGATPGDE